MSFDDFGIFVAFMKLFDANILIQNKLYSEISHLGYESSRLNL